MGFFDQHVALRLHAGLLIVTANKAIWDDILDGFTDDRTRDAVWDKVFPLEAFEGEEAVRRCRVVIRTAYPRLGADARQPPDPASKQGVGTGPMFTVDLVEERSFKKELGGGRRVDQETVELLISAGTKDEVRCLHAVAREIIEDSVQWFGSIGYAMVHADGPSGDLRPADSAFLGQPHLLGAFNRFLRMQATINRKSTRIFSKENLDLVDVSKIRVNHIDAFDADGNPGAVIPVDTSAS